MKNRTPQTVMFAVLCLVFSTAFAAAADIFMKQKNHTDPMTVMGQSQPAKDEVHTVWITAKGARNDNPAQSILFRLDKNLIIVLDHKKKTALEIPLGQGKSPFSGVDQSQGQNAPAIQDMLKNMMKMKVTVTPTGEKKKINDWTCTKYIQTIETGMGQNKSEIWASEDVKVDPDLFARYSAAMMAQNPALSASMDDIIKEMKKVKGMTVYSVSSMAMMGTTIKTTTELVECREGTAPAGILDVPAGYKKTSFDQM